MPNAKKQPTAKPVAKKPTLPTLPPPVYPPGYREPLPADTPLDQLPIEHPLVRAHREGRAAARLPNDGA